MEALKKLFKEINRDLHLEQCRKLGYLDAIDDVQNLIISKLELAASGICNPEESKNLRDVALEIELVCTHMKTLCDLKYNC